MNFNDSYFQTMFWEWFDNLDECERHKFQYYPSNMADLYFYNKYYRKLLSMNDAQLEMLNIEINKD